MKTYNIRYRSHDKLHDFLYTNEIVDSSDILIQIFSYELNTNKIKEIVSQLKNLLPSAKIIGTTTDGEILDGRILTKDIVLSFTLFEHTKLTSKLLPLDNDSFAIGQKLVGSIVNEDTKALIVFATSKELNAQNLLQGICSECGEIVVSGGLSGDRGSFQSGYIFDNDEISDYGVVAVALSSENLHVSNLSTSEWEPVGREFTITKSKDNRLISVDKMSVRELYAKYLGEEIAKQLPLSGLQFPFVLKSDDRYLVRSILSDPGDGSMLFGTTMPEGEKIQIGFGDAKTMLQNSRNIVKNLGTFGGESTFVYGSAGRRRFLKQYAHYEIESFTQLGAVSGFYGYGEFCANGKDSLFLNQSVSVLSMRESSTPLTKEIHFKEIRHANDDLQIMRALSHIAKISAHELQELNQKLEARVKEEVQKNRKKDGILIHNSKLAQMGEMMSLIAHQWRQPLNAISATSTGLHVKIELGRYDEDFFLSSLNKIEEYVKHLSTTVDDFTNFFKPSKRTHETDCAFIIERALFILSASLSKNSIDVRVENNSDTTFTTYPNEVIQVVINLVKNAENILLKREIKNPQITISAYEKEDKHIIEVSDNGGGIEEDIIEKIFEPYFTTKNHESSTGLGLYMSKFIIQESCKGSLVVKNDQNGACFTITL